MTEKQAKKRTEAKAREIIQRIRAEAIADVTDADAKQILSPEFVASVLDIAWENQFNEDRPAVRGDIRQLISDAIERLELEAKR